MSTLPTSKDDDLSPTPGWPGLPVTCQVCLQAGLPTMTDDGWRLPVHRWDGGDTRSCPGSLAAVGPPVAPGMENRIEDRFVRAMPPAPPGQGASVTLEQDEGYPAGYPELGG